MIIDEEQQFMYKEGIGRLERPRVDNLTYCSWIIGNWSRGILHGKRVEIQFNPKIFPIAYT